MSNQARRQLTPVAVAGLLRLPEVARGTKQPVSCPDRFAQGHGRALVEVVLLPDRRLWRIDDPTPTTAGSTVPPGCSTSTGSARHEEAVLPGMRISRRQENRRVSVVSVARETHRGLHASYRPSVPP
ncbi:hypothetical protein FXW78_25830 [Rhodococcus opacus]|nr:hypothetical protein [Rhodococcus opacus]